MKGDEIVLSARGGRIVRGLLAVQWLACALFAVLPLLPDGAVGATVRDVVLGSLIFAVPASVIAIRGLLVHRDREGQMPVAAAVVVGGDTQGQRRARRHRTARPERRACVQP